MAAGFKVMFDFGGTDGTPGTEQNVDELGPPCIRFKTVDDATIDANNPIPAPNAGTKYSYWKQIYLECTNAPDTQVDNVKFYTDGGGYGAGITTKVGTETPVKNSGANTGYKVATGTLGDTGNEMVAAHAGLSGSADVFSFTSGSTKALSISEAGSIINAIGEMTNYLIFQVEVGMTAAPRDGNNETWSISYDEI